jgi:hypothetical protein
MAAKYGPYFVYFSMNGVDFQPTSFQFKYTAEPIILAITPPLGPDGGGSRVVVRGANLGYRASSIVCDFTSSMIGKVTKIAGSKYRVAGTWDADRSDIYRYRYTNIYIYMYVYIYIYVYPSLQFD